MPAASTSSHSTRYPWPGIELDKRQPVSIGQHPSNDDSIAGDNVEQMHCRISWNKQGFEVVSAGSEEYSLGIREDRFYLSVAPYVDQTHDCFHHSLTTCKGELTSTDVQVQIVDVTNDEVLVDTMAMKLVMKPQQFDVIVTTNTFGDILSDAAAGLVGGLGLAAGLSAGPERAMAQATHGSAPDIAGKDIANPYAMIMSGKMLFEWLALRKNEPKAAAAAEHIGRAVERVIADARHLTRDLGGSAGTRAMGDAIAEAVAS